MKHLSLVKYGLCIVLTAFTSTAFAEYYVVYSAPPQPVYIESTAVVASPCRVSCHPVHHCCKRVHHCYKKVHYCKKRYYQAKPTCPQKTYYSRQSCNISVAYVVPSCNPCNPCRSSCNTTLVQGAPIAGTDFMVTYGPAVYQANTYHANSEYSWDNRTGDDFDW